MKQVKQTIQHPVDNRPVEVTYVTMTAARRTFKAITEKAAAGEIVIITKQNIPFLQLVPLQFQITMPTAMNGAVAPDQIEGQPAGGK